MKIWWRKFASLLLKCPIKGARNRTNHNRSSIEILTTLSFLHCTHCVHCICMYQMASILILIVLLPFIRLQLLIYSCSLFFYRLPPLFTTKIHHSKIYIDKPLSHCYKTKKKVTCKRIHCVCQNVKKASFSLLSNKIWWKIEAFRRRLNTPQILVTDSDRPTIKRLSKENAPFLLMRCSSVTPRNIVIVMCFAVSCS